MNENFNPSDYGSFGELPEDQKINYEPLEGGCSFVSKTVEKNPETAHQLALIENRAISILGEAINSAGLSFEELLQKYEECRKKWDFEGKIEVLESLKQFSDIDILQGKDYDPLFLEACKSSYTEPEYSIKLQEIYLDEIDPNDLEVVANLLQDKKFSLKKELIERVNEEDLWALYESVSNDLSAVENIVRNIKNNQLKTEIYTSAVSAIEIADAMDANNPLHKHIERMQSSIADSLIESGEYETAISLVREGWIDTKHFMHRRHEIESDQFLFDLAREYDNTRDVIGIIRFIADEAFLLKIVENNGEDFSKIASSSDRKIIVEYANKLYQSLTSKPKIYQAGRLAGKNKFVVGIPKEKAQVFIGWSNTGSHGYHRDIFDSMSSCGDMSYSMNFPKELRSGGYVVIHQPNKQGEATKVIFNGSSGDFGNYSHRILEKFRDQIAEELKYYLNTEKIELEIEISH